MKPNKPLDAALSILFISPSTLAKLLKWLAVCYNVEKYWDSGSPCFKNLLFVWECDPTSSLILIATLLPKTKDWTQDMHLGGNPFIFSVHNKMTI
jgi:hypothetical protein